MNATMQGEIRRLKKNCDDLQQTLNVCQGEIDKRSKEDNQLKKEEVKIQAEKAQLIPCISQEEEDLKFKLKQAKAKMDSYFKKGSGQSNWIIDFFLLFSTWCISLDKCKLYLDPKFF